MTRKEEKTMGKTNVNEKEKEYPTNIEYSATNPFNFKRNFNTTTMLGPADKGFKTYGHHLSVAMNISEESPGELDFSAEIKRLDHKSKNILLIHASYESSALDQTSTKMYPKNILCKLKIRKPYYHEFINALLAADDKDAMRKYTNNEMPLTYAIPLLLCRTSAMNEDVSDGLLTVPKMMTDKMYDCIKALESLWHVTFILSYIETFDEYEEPLK